jgi:hypothetical protein
VWESPPRNKGVISGQKRATCGGHWPLTLPSHMYNSYRMQDTISAHEVCMETFDRVSTRPDGRNDPFHENVCRAVQGLSTGYTLACRYSAL